MKKIIVVLSLFLCIATSASAFAPLLYVGYVVGTELAPYVAAAAVLHVAAAAAGLYYYMNGSGPSSVSSSGDLSRKSQAQWIDLTAPTPMVNLRNLTAKMPYATAKNIALKKDSSGSNIYPLTAEAFVRHSLPIWPTEIGSEKQNVAGTDANSWTKITSSCWNNNNYDSRNYDFYSGGSVYVSTGQAAPNNPNIYLHMVYYCSINQPPPVPQTIQNTPVQTAAALASNGVSGDVKSGYQTELDKMFQDPDYTPVFTDDSTGLPYSPPPSSSVATPAQVAAYNAAGAAKDSQTQATNTAGNAVTVAQSAVSTAQSALSGDPTNTGLQQSLANAQKALADAQASASKLAADQTASDAANAINRTITAPAVSTAYGDGTKYDFGVRLNTFISDLKSSSLFGMPQQLLGTIPSGGQSNFNLDFGRFGKTTFDLANFGSSITLIRSLVLIIFSFSGFKIVTLKG